MDDQSRPHENIDSAQMKLLSFLRNESAAAREMLVRESKANRDAFFGTLKLFSWALALIVAIAGFFGWKNYQETLSSIKSQAREQTDHEIKVLDRDIRTEIDDQFQTP